MLEIFSLSVLVLLLETLLVPVPTYASETMLWTERSRIMAVQVDNLRCLLGIKRMVES